MVRTVRRGQQSLAELEVRENDLLLCALPELSNPPLLVAVQSWLVDPTNDRDFSIAFYDAAMGDEYAHLNAAGHGIVLHQADYHSSEDPPLGLAYNVVRSRGDLPPHIHALTYSASIVASGKDAVVEALGELGPQYEKFGTVLASGLVRFGHSDLVAFAEKILPAAFLPAKRFQFPRHRRL